jgi:hypothetical protein
MRPSFPCRLALAVAAASAAPVEAEPMVRGHGLDTLAIPGTNAEATAYAIDLNGDGSADNAFGAVLSALTSGLNTDVPGATSAGVGLGTVVHLVELRSSDAAFASDAAATATWYVGEATPGPPLFDGSDAFRFDAGFAPARFVAALVGGSFTSANPVTTTAPVDLTVRVALGGLTVALPLQGARLKFTVTPTGLAQGQVNGSIRQSDIDTIFVPALAVTLDGIVQADPQSATAMTLRGLFDTNPADGVISVDEVATSPLIGSILAPDVDIRDANGNYAPNPANTSRDALSLGFGFTAVTSTTLLPQVFADGFEP